MVYFLIVWLGIEVTCGDDELEFHQCPVLPWPEPQDSGELRETTVSCDSGYPKYWSSSGIRGY